MFVVQEYMKSRYSILSVVLYELYYSYGLLQGRVKEALDDYALAVLLERSKGLPPTNMEKIDELVKQLATSQLNGVMEMVKAGKVRLVHPVCVVSA